MAPTRSPAIAYGDAANMHAVRWPPGWFVAATSAIRPKSQKQFLLCGHGGYIPTWSIPHCGTGA